MSKQTKRGNNNSAALSEELSGAPLSRKGEVKCSGTAGIHLGFRLDARKGLLPVRVGRPRVQQAGIVKGVLAYSRDWDERIFKVPSKQNHAGTV